MRLTSDKLRTKEYVSESLMQIQWSDAELVVYTGH